MVTFTFVDLTFFSSVCLCSVSPPHPFIASVMWDDRCVQPSGESLMCGLTCPLVSSEDTARILGHLHLRSQILDLLLIPRLVSRR